MVTITGWAPGGAAACRPTEGGIILTPVPLGRKVRHSTPYAMPMVPRG